jgi:hypothetical protein
MLSSLSANKNILSACKNNTSFPKPYYLLAKISKEGRNLNLTGAEMTNQPDGNVGSAAGNAPTLLPVSGKGNERSR